MIPFGDDDPEDAYDAGDPIAERVAVMRRVVPSIRAELEAGDLRDRFRVRADDALARVEVMLTEDELDDDLHADLIALEAALINLIVIGS